MTTATETELEELKTESLKYPTLVQDVRITDAISFSMANDWAKTIKARIIEIKEKFSEPKAKAFAAHRAITKFESDTLAPLEDALKKINAELSRWHNEQEALRKAEAKRLQDAADKAAEDAKLEHALKAEQAGQSAVAEKILGSPVLTPMVKVAPQPKAEGLSFSETWGVDETCIVNANLIPRNFLIPDIKTLNALAKSQKGNFNVPGVKPFCKKTPRHIL